MIGIHGLWSRRSRRCSGVLLASLAALGPLAGDGSAAPTPSDVAATHAFLVADLQLQQSDLADALRDRPASRALAAQVGHECPGVLTGLSSTEASPAGELPRTPRARGERDREAAESQAIDSELRDAVFAPVESAVAVAEQRFAMSIAGLRWSDPRVSQAIAVDLGLHEATGTPTPTQVCADMRMWADSGFRSLPAVSRGLRERYEAAVEELFDGFPEALLRPFEGRAERALLRRIGTIELRRGEVSDSLEGRLASLRGTLGAGKDPFGGGPEAERKIGNGPTAAGSRFTVATQKSGPSNTPGSCRAWVGVEYTTFLGGPLDDVAIGSGPSLCIRGAQADEPPKMSCESGDLTITASVSGARRVSLRFAGGRSIVSRAVLVPRGDGGPGAVYAQALRRSRGRPTALVEVDAHGHVVRTVRLGRPPRCRQAEGELPEVLTLARGLTPSGTGFAIHAIVPHVRSTGAPDIDAGPSSGAGEALFPVSPSQPYLATKAATECAGGQRYTIVFGVLKAPATTVLARTTSGTVALSLVPLPSRLRADGQLAYGVFPVMPSELIVESSSGAMLATESLAERTRDATEYCEGLAEP